MSDRLLSDEELDIKVNTKMHFYAQAYTTREQMVYKREMIDLINTQKRLAVENFKSIVKLSDTYTFEDGTKYYSEKELEKQKRLYAESVIGEDEPTIFQSGILQGENDEYAEIKNELRAEQRARNNFDA